MFELIKNSYDACAGLCIVEFNFQNGKLISLAIEDDGFGMNKDVIEKVWLVVGTDSKKKKLEPNQCNRIPLGEKGIGRLSIHKLGSKIQLVSKTKQNEEIELFIDWNKLYEAKAIKDFTIDLIENTKPKTFLNSTGTKIIIKDLKTDWDRRQLREVYRNITSLNSPFSDGNDTFRVLVKSNTNVFEGLPDFEDIKNNALYFGHCKMRGGEIVEFKYEFKPWSTLDRIDSGRKIELKDLLAEDKIIKKWNSETRKFIDIDLNESEVGTIEFDIVIFDTDAQIFSYVNTEKAALKTYLRENGGVRVYRDGVRVYNYGERDNDWLGIDLKRVHRVGGNVSNNIVIGSVKIKRDSSTGLIEKTNREGFIENEHYFDFVEAVNYALSLIVRERNTDKTILTNLYKKHRSIEPVLSDLNEVMAIVENKVDNKEIKNEILKYLYRINDQYKEVKEVLIKSANAGLNLGIVIHELEKLIAELTGCIERNDKDKAIRISLSLEKIIRGYSAMLKKSDIRLNKLSEIVSIALDNYEFRFLDHSINIITNKNSTSLEAYLAKAESISVLTNLLDNSIFWLSYARKTDKYISVYITDQIKGYNSIIVSDNGPGFNLPLDVAIEPFQTGKPHNIGSGLGLHVAKEMMIAMKGKLLLISDENEIDFPTPVRDNKVTKAIVALCFPK
ncbi:Signal transduction histidine kinase [Algoriphagus boritolerans DSM 17298 = JCM 18970]|uniref:Signal transduction histidine kinase n=1 Tax=Algoriphagus boritolerans DSM 17298 = JCM 18970 TaxID=1120964 RepID=A0A1H5XUX5_9BACT|nr:Signal transduction histidine kinase [Algoriphagus boritolerans DSM 17298 = JCM 18970]